MPADSLPTATPDVPDAEEKFFTVEEANRALAYVAPIVDDITASYRRAIELRKELESVAGDAGDALVESYEEEMDRLNRLVDELEAVGVQLKDYEKGLLDFPARHEGRTVLLCWKRGEAAVEAWHEVDGGFAGRQPVQALE